MGQTINPLISIIVSVYNGEKYLNECIDSVLNQDYSNIELIVVDDGSKDNSGRILDDYARNDARVLVIHKLNSGVSDSRNHALSLAKGRYVAFLDQDDVLDKGYISYLYDLISKCNADIALTSQPKKFFGRLPLAGSFTFKAQVLTGIEMARMMLYHKIVIAPWNKLISRELIEKSQIRFNKSFFNGEGFAFSIECFLKAQNVAMGNGRLYYYRVGDPDSGASVFKEAYILSSINAQQYIKSVLIENNLWGHLCKAWHFSNWHTHCDAFNIMVGCGVKKQANALYKKIRRVCQVEALCVMSAPVSLQQKLRGMMFKIYPYMAARIINKFRVRRFVRV